MGQGKSRLRLREYSILEAQAMRGMTIKTELRSKQIKNPSQSRVLNLKDMSLVISSCRQLKMAHKFSVSHL